MEPAVLVVDDDHECLESYRLSLRLAHIRNVVLCDDARKAADIIRTTRPAAIVLDLAMPGMNGEKLLTLTRERYPEIPVVVITATNAVETAVRCMQLGAIDYLVKPVEESRLVAAVRNALERSEFERVVDAVRTNVIYGRVRRPETFGKIISCSPLMKSLFSYVEAVAASPSRS